MTIKKMLLYILMLITFTGCFNKDEHKRISVINNSDKDIYVDYSPWVPDSLCTEIYQVHADPKWHLVKAHSSGSPHSLGQFYCTWDNYISLYDTFLYDLKLLDLWR